MAVLHPGGEEAVRCTWGVEDRDGAQGLHRSCDRQGRGEAAGGRISLGVRIAPHEFEALFAPGTGAPDIRSAFQIDTGEGIVTAALREIDDYDPREASVKCLFERIDET